MKLKRSLTIVAVGVGISAAGVIAFPSAATAACGVPGTQPLLTRGPLTTCVQATTSTTTTTTVKATTTTSTTVAPTTTTTAAAGEPPRQLPGAVVATPRYTG